jgi:hypothetical protein
MLLQGKSLIQRQNRDFQFRNPAPIELRLTPNWCGTKLGTQKLVAKPPLTVILKTYLVKREIYLVRKTRCEFLKKGHGNG